MPRIPIVGMDGNLFCLSKKVRPLIRKTVREFCSRWTPAGRVIHIEDGSGDRAHFDEALINETGAAAEIRGRVPNIVVYIRERNRLVLVETITKDGPISQKRRDELQSMFSSCKAQLEFVTTFPNRKAMIKHLGKIAWGTEAWAADTPDHLILFDDDAKLIGPYAPYKASVP